MIDITFVTSNYAKLAHARYLCRNYPVNILHYKKLFYGVGYTEPRINERSQLLTASFKDAVLRWKKNVSKGEDRLFFIEDTSVIIDALSSETIEVPGVDVKYWMRETSFETLDKELRARGNNRKCRVTSHIVLFLTDYLKKITGIKEDFKVFSSTSYGYVTEKEYRFETQLLYPWLDNKTFNKWFVPEGFSCPVSMLNISDAEAGDFRKNAFLQMMNFLENNGAINNNHNANVQLPIQFYDCFIVCGKTCAGKSTIGKHLVDKYGYYHIEASDFMTQKLLETHGVNNNIDKHIFAAAVLNEDQTFVVKRLVSYLLEHGIFDKFIITGFRTKEEVKAFHNILNFERIRIIFINSSFVNRFRRWKKRNRDDDNYTKDRFREIDSVQDKLGVGHIANISVPFENNMDGLSSYLERFDRQFLFDLKQESNNICEEELRGLKVSLEKAILITLALEYRKDEKRWFTTTEISHLINQYFRLRERSKNNVSRYFNQAVYVYYEVKSINRKNRYQISSIGYSEAMSRIKNLKSEYVKE